MDADRSYSTVNPSGRSTMRENMTTKKYICLLLIHFMFFGCSSVANTSIAVTQSPTSLPAKTTTSPMTSSVTLLPSETLTLSSTLMPDEAQEAMQALLWDNPDCLAPCFMDVVPEQTSSDDLSDLFRYLGRELRLTNIQGPNEFYEATYRFVSGLTIYIQPIVQSGKVKNINLLITPPDNQNSSTRLEWSAYSPDSLIAQYGLPSEVEFAADRGPSPIYVMDMYFDKIDFIIEYSYNLSLNLRVCPLIDQIYVIRIWSGKNPVNPPYKGVPLEDATQMTMKDFSNLIMGNQNESCFDLTEEMFP